MDDAVGRLDFCGQGGGAWLSLVAIRRLEQAGPAKSGLGVADASLDELHCALQVATPPRRFPWRQMALRAGGVSVGVQEAGAAERCIGHFHEARNARLAIAAVNASPRLLAIAAAAQRVAGGDCSREALEALSRLLNSGGTAR